MEQQRSRERKFCRRVYGTVAVMTLWAVLFSAILLSVANDMYAFIKPSAAIEIHVSEPMTAKEISTLFSDRGVIRNPTVFYFYLRAKQQLHQAETYVGTLSLNSDMSYREILAELKKTNSSE